ncbi:hypothetical protein GQ53DRAFT_850651 [Thozetella sp. PMI_491]|nr:hypothetical protein GQ53DRAFT_850651 [Thozetella sp. PMI_491]
MWPDTAESQDETRRSQIACYSCRRSQLLSNREFPRCQVCEQTDQPCNYPLRAMKPGPKIGSLQRMKRRAGERCEAEKQDSQTSSSPGASHPNRSQSCGYEGGEEAGSPVSAATEQQWAVPRRDSRPNINDLSFILHPCHEASTPEKETKDPATGKDTRDKACTSSIRQACHTLGVTEDTMETMIQTYFDNMVAINLFHEPTFLDKLRAITSQAQIGALLAAVVGYAARFYPTEILAAPEPGPHPIQTETPTPQPEPFVDMALKFVDEALVECDDEPPPVCVIQALTLAAHCQLTRGVHGKAWRSLGMCVRLAYELNLHLVDAGGARNPDPSHYATWREEEEKRRVWWAIWEMDVFASTIRRTPTAIDWAHIETLLPVDDADWFKDRPAGSTFMERDPIQRWKSLQNSGNQSPKAWFLVINSMMKDAQIISSPHGVPYYGPTGSQGRPIRPVGYKPKDPCLDAVEDAKQQLEILANAVQCFGLALPPHLRYRSQYLGFDPPAAEGGMGSRRQLHCGIYNIYVMTQLARLMIHRYDVFRPPMGKGPFGANTAIGVPQFSSPGFQDLENPWVRQYFEAADNILSIVNRCCEEHIQHINPFLLSTIWLASAVQLVRKYLGRSSTNAGLIKSRFDVLYLTYKRCVSFWNAKTALQQNLETLEMQLEMAFQLDANDRIQNLRENARESPEKSTRSYFSWVSDKSSPRQNFGDEASPIAIRTGSRNIYPPPPPARNMRLLT